MPRPAPAREMDALVSALARAVDGDDRKPIVDTLRRLTQVDVHSERHRFAHERLRTLRPQAIRALYEPGDVEGLREAVREDWVYAHEVWDALDSHSETLAIDDVIALAAAVGVPTAFEAPELVDLLAQHPDDAVTSWLEALIEAACAREQEDGASHSRHARAMTAFRYIRWQPDDGGLAHAVAILARRRDPRAARLIAGYSRELPWGEDRRATHVLFDALSTSDDEADRVLVREALKRHRAPGTLRLLLLGAVGEFDVDAALAAAVTDLSNDLDDEGRIAYLNWLADALAEIEQRELPIDREQMARRIEALDTRGWSALARGLLGVIVAVQVPDADAGGLSSSYERGLLRLVQAFTAARLDHMGCMVSLPVLFGLGELLLLLLDVTIGHGPPRPESLVDDAALVGWLLVAAVTSHTHFSGNETLRQRLWMAVAYFATLAAFLVVAVTLRAS